MDSRILFVVLSVLVLFAWEYFTVKHKTVENHDIYHAHIVISQPKNYITVKTNNMILSLDKTNADIDHLVLIAHHHKYNILNNKNKFFIVHTLPQGNLKFHFKHSHYVMQKDKLYVSATAISKQYTVVKSYTFYKNSYVIKASYDIFNKTGYALKNFFINWNLLRDSSVASHSRFVNTFSGAAYYTNNDKFNKVSYKDIQSNQSTYPSMMHNGWVGFIEHYFATMWLITAEHYHNPCISSQCTLTMSPIIINGISVNDIKLHTVLPTILPHSHYSITLPLFAGTQRYTQLITANPTLERVKDYGWVYILSKPLFWLLVQIEHFIGNWGWSIVLLTLLVKIVFYPLTKKAYISMAKMRDLAPKMEHIKSTYSSDKTKLQQEMMALYKKHNVNPLGGCLPMVLQIPVFIGLYWALLSSVELKYSTFLWIADLSRPDPYYILPLLLAGSMFLQVFISPASNNAMQNRIAKFMPMAFSIIFFFFPAGLVIYWLTNNLLSLLQQWYVNYTLKQSNQN